MLITFSMEEQLPKYDLLVAWLDPKDVCGWLGIKGNYLGHEVAVTIGHPTEPPRKRGQKARYSVRDVVGISLGRELLRLGITPARIRTCVELMRTNWDLVAPTILDLDAGESSMPLRRWLLAGESATDFEAMLIETHELVKRLGLPLGFRESPRPAIVHNVSAFVYVMTIGLLRRMQARGKELPLKE
jgi:hypothetical protein